MILKLALQLILGTVLSALVSTLAYRFKLLTSDGASAAFLLGAIIFGTGGIGFALPLLFFFLSSSLLSRYRQSEKIKYRDIFERVEESSRAGVPDLRGMNDSYSVDIRQRRTSPALDGAAFEKTGARDKNQVLANGVIAGMLAFIYFLFPAPSVYFAYLACLATVNADTWGTEILSLQRGT